MGLIFLQQTDTPAVCGLIVACSGASAPSVGKGRQATEGGTVGTTAETVTLKGSGSGDQYVVAFETTEFEPGLINWKAGDWVVRLNVTTANIRVTWVATYVCKINALCGGAVTVGSLTGQSIIFGTGGVKTMTVSGSAVSGLSPDRAYIVLVFSNSISGTSPFGFTPDQIIDTPLVASIAPLRRRREGY